MEQEFRIKKGWLITAYIFSGSFTAMAILMFYYALTGEREPVFLAGLGVFMLTFALFVGVAAIKFKITIGGNSITVATGFTTKTLHITEIAGFRSTFSVIIISPIDKTLPTLRIDNPNYIENINRLLYWLNNRPNLDVVEYNLRRKEMVDDIDIGMTAEDRVLKIKQARLLTRGLTIGAAIIATLLIFYPIQYKILAIAAMAYVPLCLLIIYFNKAVSSFGSNNADPYPNLILALLLSSGALVLRAMFDFDLVNYLPVILPFSIVALVLTVAFFSLTKIKTAANFFSMFIICILPYSYGSTVITNCLFDKGIPNQTSAKVLDKRINADKRITYHLTLSPWGNRKEADEVEVPKALYDSVIKGQEVYVNTKPGYLQVPWFYVSDN